jgi:hypothetical protein
MRAVGASHRVFELLQRQPNMPPAGSERPRGSGQGGEVRLENVWFSYPSSPDTWILKVGWCLLLEYLCRFIVILDLEASRGFVGRGKGARCG